MNLSNITVPVEIHNNTPITPGCHLYSFVVQTILIGLLCILGLVGNIVAYIVFWKDNIKTSTTFLFQALSLIDSILLIVVFPIYVLQPIPAYLGGMTFVADYMTGYIAVFILPVAFLMQTATIWVTVLVGFNRYIAVCQPYQASRLCNIQMARKYLLAVLLVSLLYNIPRFAQSKLQYHWDAERNTTIVAPAYTALGGSKVYQVVYNNICYMIFLLFLPLLTLTVLNVKLINALKELKRKRMEMQSLRQQQDNNVTFVLIIVVLVFTVCQLPALLNQILWNLLSDAQRDCGGFQYYFSRISNMLVITNSAINFLIYFLFNTRFRQVFLEQIWCWKCQPEDKDLRNGKSKNETTQTLL